MENWNEVRTAYQVARLGTVSAAAEALGLHRVTVIRHIDVLEAALNEKLFIRHTKGYTPTDAGHEMMRVAQDTEDRFQQLSARIKAQAQVQAGELVVTSLPVAARLIMPALQAFRLQHPEVNLRHIASARTLKLERGEAHIAVRTATNSPEAPDNIVQEFRSFQFGLFASPDYLDRRGMPETLADLHHHDFVAPDAIDNSNSAALYLKWLRELVPADNIVFRSTDITCLHEAIFEGVGIGFLALSMPQPREVTHIPLEGAHRLVRLNLVTHVDLHRTKRVQALLRVLNEKVRHDL